MDQWARPCFIVLNGVTARDGIRGTCLSNDANTRIVDAFWTESFIGNTFSLGRGAPPPPSAEKKVKTKKKRKSKKRKEKRERRAKRKSNAPNYFVPDPTAPYKIMHCRIQDLKLGVGGVGQVGSIRVKGLRLTHLTSKNKVLG